MDPEVVAKEMQREKDENGVCLFTISEFLTPLQVSSVYFGGRLKIINSPHRRSFHGFCHLSLISIA